MAFEAVDLLAGPVVRRVTPASVAVWAVTRKPAHVVLQVFRDEDASALEAAVETDTTAIGEALHFVLAFLELPTGQRLEPGRTYGYDLRLDGRGLGDLGLLRDGAIDGHRHLALGYVAGKLPTFVAPPATAGELTIAHGSCRRPYASGNDGLVALDQRIERARHPGLGARRPHLMCHTGDQIYADDLSPELLTWMSDLAVALIGKNASGVPIERIRVDLPGEPAETAEFPVDALHFPPGRRQRLMVRAAGFTSGDGESHTFGLGEYVAQYLFAWCNLAWPRLDDDAVWRQLHAERGALVRDFLTAWLARYREARFFVEEGRAVPGELDRRVKYLEAWRLVPRASRAIDQVGRDPADEAGEWAGDADADWQAFWSGVADQPGAPATTATIGATSGVPRSALVGTDAQLRKLADLTIPAWYAGAHHVRVDVAHQLGRDPTPASADATFIAVDQVLAHMTALRRFYQGLPFARRALANVSNLMMFDDHEVTDDWNISRQWVTRVRGKAMGRDILRNGLVAYALCQDWGNAPERYLPAREDPARPAGANRDVLDAAQLLFRTGPTAPRTSGPAPEPRAALEHAFALDGSAGTAIWDYRVGDPDIAPYEILALDNRTRRGFDTSRASPANITDEAMVAQIPAQPPAGAQVTIVIAPLPPLGFPPLEQVGQPYLNMLHDYQQDPERADALRRRTLPQIERDYMFGRLIKDPEPWGFHPHALEQLLARLASRRAVLFLSGDVHYALTGKMTYWKRGASMRLEPVARFVQLTSSGLLNQTGAGEILLAHLGLSQQFGAVVTGPYDRLGWASAGVGGPTLPSSEPLSRHVTRLLQQEPVLVPTRALPEDTLTALRAGTLPVPPEWAWRLEQVKDLRLDDDRYQALAGAGQAWRLPAEAELADPVLGARKLANHHDWHARNGAPRRFLMTSNLCVVELAPTADGGLETVHAMFSWDKTGFGPSGAGAAASGSPWPDARLAAQPYTLHRISLDPADELAPDREAPP